MLRRPGAAGIERVEVHLEVVGHVPADHRALEEMDVVERLGDPRSVVEVLCGGIAVGVGLKIDDMDRRACRAEMDVGASEMKVVLRVAAEEGDVARGDGQHVFDQSAGKADATILALHGPGAGQNLYSRPRRLAEADHLQRLKRGGMNLRHPGIGQGPVLPARQPRPDRPQPLGEGRRPRRSSRLTSRARRPPGFAVQSLFHTETLSFCPKILRGPGRRPGPSHPHPSALRVIERFQRSLCRDPPPGNLDLVA